MNQDIDFDFDLDHYNLEDLLTLFKMPLDFDVSYEDMRRAKKIVLQIHPDKSKLPPKYFLFYSKAYKLIYSLWDFKNKKISTSQANVEYTVDENDKQALLQSFFKENETLQQPRDFNRWFNEAFEKNREPEEKGYSDWFHNKDANNDLEEKVTTMDAMAQQFEKRKEKARSLVVYKEVEDFALPSLGASELSAPDSFDSGLFSSLPFQDLKKAHEETVIPVTHRDFESKVAFRSVNDLLQFRGRQDVRPLSEIEAEAFLREKKRSDDTASIQRSYDLARQTERMESKLQSGFWSTLQTLTHKKI